MCCVSRAGAVAHLNAYFGQGTGPIALNRVQCLGNESSLTDCLHTIINSCGHSDDAGVSCIGVSVYIYIYIYIQHIVHIAHI